MPTTLSAKTSQPLVKPLGKNKSQTNNHHVWEHVLFANHYLDHLNNYLLWNINVKISTVGKLLKKRNCNSCNYWIIIFTFCDASLLRKFFTANIIFGIYLGLYVLGLTTKLFFVEKNNHILKTMDKGLTVPKWVL